MSTIFTSLASLVLADSRPLVVVTLGLIALGAGLVAILAARGEGREPNPSDVDQSLDARGAARRRLTRITWLVGAGAGAVTVLTAVLLGVAARPNGQGGNSSSSSTSSAQVPAEVASESDELQAPSSVPQAAPSSGGGLGFGSGGS